MFTPINPEIELLVEKIKSARLRKHEIDKEIADLPFLYSRLEDLKKEIGEIEKKILDLSSKKADMLQEQSDLSSRLKERNKIELQSNSDSLAKEIQTYEKEVRELTDNDFRHFMNSMTEENTMECYLSYDTSTTPLMDEFSNNKDKDFLVLKGIFWGRDLVITKYCRNVTVANVSSPTMTELKTFRSNRIPKRMRPLYDLIHGYDRDNLKKGQKVQFEIPLPLGGQTYANQTGYGWEWDWSGGYGSYTEGTYYGEVTTFFIIGFIVSRQDIFH